MSSVLLKSTRAARVSSSRYTVASSIPRRYSSTVHDNNPEVLEKEKAKNLSGKHSKDSHPHEHAPGWNEHLASSSSEANVKADQDRHSPGELQKHSIERIKAMHHADDVMTGMQASYEKDEVEGPLKTAMKKTKTFVKEVKEKI